MNSTIQTQNQPSNQVFQEIKSLIKDEPEYQKQQRRISCDTFFLEQEITSAENQSEMHKTNLSKYQAIQQAMIIYVSNYAANLQGKFIKKLTGKDIFVFECNLQHNFMLTRKQLLAGAWCPQCSRIFQNIKSFAQEHKGEVLIPQLQKQIEFRCAKGHTWKMNFRKSCQKWCKECAKQEKKLLKQLIEEENRKIELEKKIRQNKLLEEAKQKYLSSLTTISPLGGQQEQINNLVGAQEILSLARGYAEEYVRGQGLILGQQVSQEDLNYLIEKYSETYRILIISNQILVNNFIMMGIEEAKKDFRRLAFLLHPDKNNHPYAKMAFQKLYQAFKDVVQNH